MKITFSTPLTAADAGRRTITGRIVTWGEVGHTSAGPALFEPNSIEFSESVVLRLEHDRTRPLGRMIEANVHDLGIDASFKVAGTRAGDDALVEASEQLRDGLSVGVNVIDFRHDDEGTLIVSAAEMDEVSLVTHPAIQSARVVDVAASETPEGETMNDPEIIVVDDETESVEVVEVVEASRPAPVAVTRPRVAPFRDYADYILTAASAARGDHAASLRIAAADQKIADNSGLVPVPIVGNVIDTLNADRPIVASSRRLPMPSAGKSFERPMIVQHTTVGVQANELDALASQKMTIDPITINKVTVGGQLRISFQDRDWTDPAILNIVVGDLQKQYARQTEAGAAVELDLGATGKEVVAANAASDVFVGGIYKAAAKVYAATGQMPNVIYCNPDQWVRMGSMVDAQKRPVFPALAPSNAYGTQDASSFAGNPLGLRLVVSGDLPAGGLIVGNTEFIETYENGPMNLSVVDVSTLGFTVATYGYFAAKVTVGGAFVEFATA